LPQATNATAEIWRAAAQLLADFQPAAGSAVRLLGVGLSGLESSRKKQLSLFADERQERDDRLDAVRDSIQQRFGSSALQRGSGMLHRAEHQPLPRPQDTKPRPSQHEPR
jgi:hypothetical protein